MEDKKELDAQKQLVKMSKAEKLFWACIVFLMLIYIAINMVAKNKQNLESDTNNSKAIMIDVIQNLVTSDMIKQNLSKNQTKILESLDAQQKSINKSIDNHMDVLFAPVYANVDSFLDFHYSVLGEYLELGSAAFGDMNQLIIDKLFTDDFDKMFISQSSQIDKKYKIYLDAHLSDIKKYALEDVDINLNNDVLVSLKKDIDLNIHQQQIKAGILGGIIGTKVAAVISAKIGAKVLTKGAVKTTAKVATKGAAASAGAAAGLSCGPFFWICSPVAAGALWFGTDLAVVSVDEHFSREKFKNKIYASLDENKLQIKNSFKEAYFKSLKKVSDITIQKHKNTKVRKRVKDLFELPSVRD